MAKVRKDRTKPRRPTFPAREDSADVDLHFGGFLGKLGSMVEKLAELAETGQNLAQSGELKGLDPQGKLRGVYGFSIKTGIGEQGRQEVKIEPFGNIHQRLLRETLADDVREPLVDVYEEEDHVLVLAEIPGVSKKEVQLDLAQRPVDDLRPARRETLSQGSAPAGELHRRENALAVRQRDFEDPLGPLS